MSFLFIFCNHNGKDFKGISRPVKDSLKVRLYYREVSSNNGFGSYIDFLAVEGYENNVYRLKDLLLTSIKYIDTVRSDNPVSMVSFVGEPPGKVLPPGRTSRCAEHVKYRICSVAFNTSFWKNVGKDKKINWISLWKKGEFKIYYNIDSLQHVNPILDNGGD
jgi:hypothetical protein